MNEIYCQLTETSQIRDIENLTDSAGANDFIKMGFTGVVVSGDLLDDAGVLRGSGLDVISEKESSVGFNFDHSAQSSNGLWTSLEPLFGNGLSSYHDGSRFTTLLLQLSIPLIPQIGITSSLLPSMPEYHSIEGRAYRELLRSLTFWRTRNHIAQETPRLVHANDSGLLIFVIDSWLVAINHNTDEESIDIGSGGNMWLMLGTDRDVHLHGSLLVLPANSGAILANELAR